MRSFLVPARPLLPALALVLIGCASTPSGPPEEVAPRIVARLDAGEIEQADELFEGGAKGPGRELLYPLLYEAARARFERGEPARSAGVLRFMARHYPRSGAVQEALAYALFVERAASERPDPELVREMESALAALQGRDTPWIALVQAQHAIDRGELSEARQAFARFSAARPETSPTLAVYIDDIDRYLRSHP